MRIAIAFIATFGIMLMTSCSHNASLFGIGSALRVGSGEAGLWYGDGLFLNSVSRENVKFNAELDSTMGVVKDPENGSYKGIKSLSFEVGPQLGGYASELGEKNPEALKSYYDALAKYYEFRVARDVLPASSVTEEKQEPATDTEK